MSGAGRGDARPTVVFDIGNVLLDWNPRHLYRKLFNEEARMEWFLAEVCHHDWNLEQDRGRPWPDAVAEAIARHPDWAVQIRAFDERWHETVAGPIEANVAVLRRLKAGGAPVYAITNFSEAKFQEARIRFPFLGLFDDVVVSGTEGLLKPDPAVYRLFLDRYGLAAEHCIFIDDSAANVAGAHAVGMRAIHYRPGVDLAAELARHGVELSAIMPA